MKNRDNWVPSKFIYQGEKLISSRDSNEVSVSSIQVCSITAQYYDAYIKKYVKGKLLDLGCGKVPLFATYKDYVTENVCVDWGNTLHTSEYLDLECDLTKELPFKDKEFDVIILSDVLEHIPQPEHLWKEMSRILANNGKILMNVPFYYWIHEEPHDYYRYTEFALRRFVESAGFKMILLEPIGGVPEILTDILAKTLVYIPKIGRLFAILIQQFTLSFIKTKFGGKVSKLTSTRFPLGYFLIAEKLN